MELQDSILKAFADAVNKNSGSKEESKTLYGTVSSIDGNGNVYVRLNGADSSTETPVTSMVEVGVGDKVMISLKNHTATIIGNISYPALTRVGDIYVTLTSDGLIVGKLDENNQPTGNHVLISDTQFVLRKPDGTPLAFFGSTARIGAASSMHADINSSGLVVYDGNGTLLAKFGTTVQIGASNAAHVNISSGNMIFYNASGEEVLRAGTTNSGWGSVKGIETQGNIIATNGKLLSYNENESGYGWVTTGIGGISQNYNPVYDVSLVTDKNWAGLYSHNCPNGYFVWFNRNTDQTYLYSHLEGQTAYTVPVKNLLRGGYSVLWSDTLEAVSGSTDWHRQTISALFNWDLVLVRVRCGDVYTGVVISRANSDATFTVRDYNYTYNGTKYDLTTNVKVDFSELYVSVARGAGPSDAGAIGLFRITSVTGLIRSITNYGSV